MLHPRSPRKQNPIETSLKASDSSFAHKHKCINLTGSLLDTFQQMISSQTRCNLLITQVGTPAHYPS